LSVESDHKLLEALKSNWQHARHIEDLRLRLTTVYITTMLGAGFTAIKSEIFAIQVLGIGIGLLVTIFSWAMTHKWNVEFVNQIKKADACARRLKLIGSGSDPDQLNMHSFIGFPIRDPKLPKLNVRLMFSLFYGSFLLAWIFLLFYLVFAR
jgi:hypothetical protein